MKNKYIPINNTVPTQMYKPTIRIMLITIMLFASSFLNNFFAQVTFSNPILFDTATCKFPTPYFALGNIVITESAVGDFSVQAGKTLILTAPTNFTFLPGTGSVSDNNTDITSSFLTSVTATKITVQFTVTATGVLDALTISGIQVRGNSSPSGPSSLTRLVGAAGGTATILGDAPGGGFAHATFTSVARNATVTIQPIDKSICDGGNTSFNISTYMNQGAFQWQEDQGAGFSDLADAGIYFGVNTSALTINGAPASNTGYQYRCIITGTDDVCTSDTTLLTVSAAPAITNDPIDTTVCTGDNASFSVIAVGSSLTYRWKVSTNGGSTFTLLPFVLVPPYSAVANTLYITAAPFSYNGYQYQCTVSGNCGPTVESLVPGILIVNQLPTVDAGLDATICSNTTKTLAGSRGGGASSSNWTTTGDGIFNNPSLVNAIYTPGVTDITNGTVTLTITSDDPAGPCNAVADAMTLTINPAAVANASLDDTVCSGSSYTLAGTIGGGATSLMWTTSGDGEFIDSSLVNAVYTPGPTDITNGTVTLTITTNNPPGPCNAVSDAMILTISAPALVSAGINDTICSGTVEILSGASIGGGTSTVAWTTSGDGIFADSTLVNAVYTPGITDILNGTVTLTITSDDPAGPCPAVSDATVLKINPAALVTAGIDDTVCAGSAYTLDSAVVAGGASSSSWTTSGDGLFNDPSIVMAIYTPGSTDILNGTVTLTITTDNPAGPCTLAADAMILTINTPAQVSAGLNDTICSGTAKTLTGASMGGGATSVAWTSAGDGTFVDSTIVNAIYNPGVTDIANGIVTLTITTDDPSGPCPAVVDSMKLSINPAVIVSAGIYDTICAGSTYTLSGSTGGGASSSTWSTSGNGIFSDPTLVNAVYTPGSTDISNGTVTLTITTDDPIGICTAAVDSMKLKINPPAIVTAGFNDTICSGSIYNLSGTKSGGATSSAWTTSGDGAFSDSTIVNPVYTPGATDISNGIVTLTITSDEPAGPCPAAVDSMKLILKPAVIVSAGIYDTICSGSIYTLSGSIGGGASSSTWTTSGDGTFSIASLVNAVYTPGTTDITNGTVTLTITTNDPIGICSAAVDSMKLKINPEAIVSAGLNDTICYGNTYTLSGTRSGGADSTIWTTSGDGVFSDSSLVNAVYTPGSGDSTLGSVLLTITSNDPVGICPVAIDAMTLYIGAPPFVSAGINDTICFGSTYTLSGTKGGGASSSIWTTSGDGNFNDPSILNAVYTPGSADSTNGTVTLIITTNNPAGPCIAALDSMTLIINPEAIVTAGLNDTICTGNTYTLSGSRAGSATSSTWTTSGDGIFSNSSLVNAVYTPGTADSTLGTVFLIITSNDPVGICGAAIDSMKLTINPKPKVVTVTPATICSPATVDLTLPAVTATSTSGLTFFYYTDAAATSLYSTPAIADSGTYYIVGVILASGCSDTTGVAVTINPKPTVITNTPPPVCFPAVVNLTLSAVTAGSTAGLTYGYYTNAAATTLIPDPATITISNTYYIMGTTPEGCSDTTGVSVSVNTTAVGGTVSADALVCSGANGDTLTLNSYSGAILNWEYSVDGGITWNDTTNNTLFQNKLFYSNLLISTWYRAKVSALCDTAASAEARITVNTQPPPIGGIVLANDTVCSGSNHDTLNLTGYTGNIIRWEYSTDGGNTWIYISNTTSSHIYNNLTTTTIYHAVVQNSFCGFAISSNDTITVTPPSNAGSIGGAFPGCAYANGGILTLSGYSGAIITWQYSVNGGATWVDNANASATQVYVNLPDTTLYRAIVKSGVCSADTSSATPVVVYPKPMALFAADTVCLGGATTFVNSSTIASGAVQFNQWTFGDNGSSLSLNPTHTYTLAGPYTVSLITISNYGCLDTAIMGVLVDPLPNAQIISSGSLSFCCGGSVSLSALAGLNYSWSTTATTQAIVVNNCLASGNYTLNVTNPATLCTNSSSVSVVISPLPVANAGNDTTISLGSPITLNGQGGIAYLWTPAASVSNPAIANPVVNPEVTTIFGLTATDINGCVDTDSINIYVITDFNITSITNLLTANGDGFNDKWIVKDIEYYPGTEAIVVNREGQQVFYSSSYDNSWEGLNKSGKPLPDGTYYYFLKLKNSNKTYKGPLTILNEK